MFRHIIGKPAQASRVYSSHRFYSTSFQKYAFLQRLGLSEDNLEACYYGQGWKASGPVIQSINPNNGVVTANVRSASVEDANRAIEASYHAQKEWQRVPAPKRGDIVRQMGDRLRANKEDLGKVIQLEVGKIAQEGVGEVQEGVDICEYAVGLSRMLNGKVIPSERPNHAMLEQFNPLGVVGCITAFNFPIAVNCWNLAIALVTGNTMIWKGAPGVPLTTMALGKLLADVLEENNLPGAIACTLVGGADVGETICKDTRVPLVSFTGSTKVGAIVEKTVRARWGQTLLELGGNNAFIVNSDADLDLALRGAVFGAVGTAGQRCTSTRRLLLHNDIYDEFIGRLLKAYKSIKIGNVLEENVLCGPLHSKAQVQQYLETIAAAKQQGGRVLYGGNVLSREGNFVEPTVIEIDPHAPVAQHETFAPILYVMRFNDLDSAIAINNQTGYGLSSSLFTRDPGNIFKWMGPEGSRAGIVNVNIGNSGAEIGGAFGGNDMSGGSGTESGSDSWKHYCRRSTCTINYGKDLPLAQGIKFDF